MKLFILVLIIIAIAFAAIAIRMFVIKGGEFKKSCAHTDEENSNSCSCKNSTNHELCENYTKHHKQNN